MNDQNLEAILAEHLAEIRAVGGEEVYKVSKSIFKCPRMMACLDINDIMTTINGCDAVEGAIIDCRGSELAESIKHELSKPADKPGYAPQNLLVFIEQHRGYSLIMSDIQAFHDAIAEFPSEINVIWGMGVNPDGAGEIGLYFIIGYKKLKVYRKMIQVMSNFASRTNACGTAHRLSANLRFGCVAS